MVLYDISFIQGWGPLCVSGCPVSVLLFEYEIKLNILSPLKDIIVYFIDIEISFEFRKVVCVYKNIYNSAKLDPCFEIRLILTANTNTLHFSNFSLIFLFVC